MRLSLELFLSRQLKYSSKRSNVVWRDWICGEHHCRHVELSRLRYEHSVAKSSHVEPGYVGADTHHRSIALVAARAYLISVSSEHLVAHCRKCQRRAWRIFARAVAHYQSRSKSPQSLVCYLARATRNDKRHNARNV